MRRKKEEVLRSIIDSWQKQPWSINSVTPLFSTMIRDSHHTLLCPPNTLVLPQASYLTMPRGGNYKSVALSIKMVRERHAHAAYVILKDSNARGEGTPFPSSSCANFCMFYTEGNQDRH